MGTFATSKVLTMGCAASADLPGSDSKITPTVSGQGNHLSVSPLTNRQVRQFCNRFRSVPIGSIRVSNLFTFFDKKKQASLRSSPRPAPKRATLKDAFQDSKLLSCRVSPVAP